MTKTLHLGVIDMPYNLPAPSPKKAKKGKKRRKSKAKAKLVPGLTSMTTGDVANILEAEYGVMDAFSKKHSQDIGDAIANALVGSMQTLSMGGPVGDPFQSSYSTIEKDFRNFLDLKEIEAMGIAGVPTRAALEGKSKRFKSGYGPKPRPSFIDSGQYQSSFKAWVD